MGPTSGNSDNACRAGGAARLSALSIGLGALFSTLLIYAGTVTPFLRYENITAFVSEFAHVSLASLLACSCIFVIAMMRGALLRASALMGVGCVLYLLSSAAFCYLALSGASDPLPLYAGSVACGAGDCCMCLVWGRIFSRFALGSALLNVAASCIVAAAAYAAVELAPPMAGAGLFMTCATVAVVATLFARGDIDERETTEAVDAPKTMRALASFANVAAKPALGLLVFAYVMGLTCNIFVDVFDIYLAASSLAAFTLAALALVRMKRPLTRLLYRDLLPLLAITTLAAPNVFIAVFGASSTTMFFTLLLYTFAAFLTLATLCAIANASEFSSDFVFAAALVLFSIASLAGLLCSSLAAEAVGVVVTVATTLYAFLLVVMRDPESGAQAFEPFAQDGPSNLHGNRGKDGDDREGPSDRAAQRCDDLASEHDLTAREREILAYLAEGHSGAYISEVLFISPNTVRTHIHNIYRKLDVSSREDILRLTKG